MAGTSFCTARPVLAEMLTRAARHPGQFAVDLLVELIAPVLVDQIPTLLNAMTRARLLSMIIDSTRRSCSVIGSTRRSAESPPRPHPGPNGSAARHSIRARCGADFTAQTGGCR